MNTTESRFDLRVMLDDALAWARAGYPGVAQGRYQDAAYEIDRLRKEVARLSAGAGVDQSSTRADAGSREATSSQEGAAAAAASAGPEAVTISDDLLRRTIGVLLDEAYEMDHDTRRYATHKALYEELIELRDSRLTPEPSGEQRTEVALNQGPRRADGVGSNPEASAGHQLSHYRVERRAGDTSGCKHCGHDQQWTIVHGEGADAFEIGTSWGDQEFAQDVCDLMNEAFEAGKEESCDNAEESKLVTFFRGEGAKLGREGDYQNWTPAETAIHFMRSLSGEPSGLHVPVNLVQRTVEFLGTWRDAGPECDCEPTGHSCGWPKLRNLADDWRTLTKAAKP